jgi:hypothetical protein
MPEDADPSQSAQPETAISKGLAGVDLHADNVDSRPTSTSKFEEYNAGDDDEPRRIEMADEPVNVGGEIEVVKVKRKKKKDSSKKRTEA